MKNKKLSLIVTLIICAFAGMLFSACGTATIKGIYVKEGSISTTVEHNSTFSYQGIEIYAKISNGKEIEISSDECEFSTVDTSVVGETTLTISYGVYKTEIKINVVKKINSISVKEGSIPSTVTHKGTLDVKQAKLVVSYSNGDTDEFDASVLGATFGSIDTSTVGTKELTITYQGLTCKHYYVVEKYLEKIEVAGNYSTRIAFKSNFDTTGIKVNATYSDGTKEDITNEKLTISSLDTNDKNNVKKDNFVTVRYLGKETTIKVEIYAVLTRIEYNSGLSDRLKYNTSLDNSNLKITAYYNDDTSKVIDSNISVKGLNNQILGSQTLTISYKDDSVHSELTTTKEITVYEELESIEVQHRDASDNTTGYVLVNGTLDTSKFKVIAVYSKNRINLENDSVVFENIDTSEIGDKLLSISYTNSDNVTKSCNITIHVIENWSEVQGLIVDSISIVDASVNSEVDHNATLDISRLQITITYTNNLTATLNYSDYISEGENQIVVKNIDTSSVGEKDLEVTYKTKKCYKKITVKKVLVSISIKEGSVVSNVKYGTNLDISNVKIIATYSDESAVEVTTFTTNKNDFDNTKLNSIQTITFTYSEESINYGIITKNCSMNIQVFEEVESISKITGLTDETEWGKEYNTSKITATVVYTSGRTEEIANDKLEFGKIDTKTLGEQTLVIKYTNNGITVTYNAKVKVYDVLESIKIKEGTIQDTVFIGETFNLSGLVLSLTMKSGATKEITTGYNITQNISTETESEQILSIEYEGKTTSKIVYVRNYLIIGYDNPTFVNAYNRNKTTKNTFNKTGITGVKGFTDLNNEYSVGIDNEFNYQPVMQVKFKNNKTEERVEFKADINVYLYNTTNKSFELIDKDDTSSYVAIDYLKHTFKFNQNSVGKKFKIEVTPAGLIPSEVEIVSASVFEFNIVEGWNVYSAKDLSLFDNVNALGKWTEYKTQNNIDLNKEIKALILHNDISIKDSDIPASHFFTADELSSSDADYDKAVGSLKDKHNSDLGLIYQRKLNSGEHFKIEGNYFQISAQDLSLIVREEVDGTYPVVNDGEAITVHTALFGFIGQETNTVKSKFTLNNLSLYGNTKKTESSEKSGGIIFMKARYTDFTAYNNLSQCWFISYFFEGNHEYNNNTISTLEKINCFDAYNTMLYNWGARDVRIIDSVMIGAGGPIMICDHVENNETTGEGGYITNVKITNSVLESYIAGSEGWFATYTGSGAIVGSLKAMNALIKPYGNTICDSSDEKINLIAVYKSGSSQGLTSSAIRGSFSNTDNKFTNGLDLSNASIASLKQQVITQLYEKGFNQSQIEATVSQMAILQTFNNATGIPGTNGWMVAPDQNTFAQAEDYMNVYLFNGMAAVIGLDKLQSN